MVYNAMKLFMEINPQLFDDCTHEYNERQNTAEQREKARRRKWEIVEARARARQKALAAAPAPAPSSTAPVADGATRPDDIDSATQDSQRRLDALKLQDESPTDKERRIREQEKQNSVSPSQA